ncbi:MAG TPA: Zn-dependent alcohol dehydrogenase [Dehalococcoidia bacterium]|nr:Zn-dependent alcohol dehydrogenase [Dehalococcoidia bacterium]
MKAAVLYEIKTPLKIEDVSLDDPQQNEVLVKIVASGVCHSDLHFMNGDMPQPTPFVPGHEGAGIVEKVGPGVTTLQPGDHVLLNIAFSCGKCPRCYEGRPTLCVENLPIQMMATLPGGGIRLHKGDQALYHLFGLACFAQKVVVHERSAIKIREDAPLDVVCVLGCGVSTGIGAAINTAHVRPGESIVIYGCGGVGLSAVMGAKLAGAGTIIAVSRSDHKLNKAKELGADYVIKASEEEPLAKVAELTGGGADYAIESVGSVNVIVQALGSIRMGGTCVVAGMAPLADTLTLAPFHFLLGKTMTGSTQGDVVPQIDIPRYIDLFMAGKLPIDKLITKSYKLEQVNEAFEALEKGEAIKSVIKL